MSSAAEKPMYMLWKKDLIDECMWELRRRLFWNEFFYVASLGAFCYGHSECTKDGRNIESVAFVILG